MISSGKTNYLRFAHTYPFTMNKVLFKTFFPLNTIIGSVIFFHSHTCLGKHSLNTETDTGYSTSCTEMTVLLFLEVCNTCMHTCTHIISLPLSHTLSQTHTPYDFTHVSTSKHPSETQRSVLSCITNTYWTT